MRASLLLLQTAPARWMSRIGYLGCGFECSFILLGVSTARSRVLPCCSSSGSDSNMKSMPVTIIIINKMTTLSTTTTTTTTIAPRAAHQQSLENHRNGDTNHQSAKNRHFMALTHHACHVQYLKRYLSFTLQWVQGS